MMSVRIGSIRIIHPRRELPPRRELRPQSGLNVNDAFFRSTRRGKRLIQNLQTFNSLHIGLEPVLRSSISHMFKKGAESSRSEHTLDIFGRPLNFSAIRSFLKTATIGSEKILGEIDDVTKEEGPWGHWVDIKMKGFLKRVDPQEYEGCKAVVGIRVSRKALNYNSLLSWEA